MAELSSSVGVDKNGRIKATNSVVDQTVVIALLSAIDPNDGGAVWSLVPLATPGKCSEELAKAIVAFQDRWISVLGGSEDDGIMRRGGTTIRHMNKVAGKSKLADQLSRRFEAILEAHSGINGIRRYKGSAINPSSVNEKELSYLSIETSVDYRLVSITHNGNRFWFGLGIPVGRKRFDRAYIFFHPIPKPPFYKDSDYPDFKGGWRTLHDNYLVNLSIHVSVGIESVLIVPYMRGSSLGNSAHDPFAVAPIDKINSLLRTCRDIVTPLSNEPIDVKHIGVASFSRGINYMAQFIQQTRGTRLVKEAVDFDSGLITNIPARIDRNVVKRAIIFSQKPSGYGANTYYLPPSKWKQPDTIDGQSKTHHLICKHCMYAALQNSALR